MAAFPSAHPGNNTTLTVEFLHGLSRSESSAPEPLRDGPFNIVSYTFPIWGYGYRPEIDYAVLELADVTGRVQINPVFQQETISSSTFLPPGVNPYPGKPNMTPSPAEIQLLIDKFVAADVEIDFKFGANVADDTWSGLIDPTDPEAWFAAYAELILPWVAVAEDIGSDSIVLTNEAMTLTSKYREDWVALIEDVREVYSGRIGVNTTVHAVNSLTFADQLDFIGLSLYVPTTDKLDPSVEELAAGWRNDINGTDWLAFIEGVHESYGLPIQITELAFWSYDGAAANSNYYGGDRSDFVVDYQEQQDQYEAFFRTFSNLPERWFEGVTFWRWQDTEPGSDFDKSTWGQTGAYIDGKPAEQTVRDWLSGDRQGPGISQVATNLGGEFLDGGYNHDTLTGASGRDEIYGGRGDDILAGLGGNDILNGGPGLDQGTFSGSQSAYTLVISATNEMIVDRRTEGNGTDTLVDIEFLEFDTDLLGSPFNLTQFGGPIGLAEGDFESFIELYIAYFNRAPDAVGLNFWGTAFSNGTSLEEMATLFVDQDETRATYPNGTSNNEFATSVYTNVLGRTPDQGGIDFWVGALDSNAVSRDQFILEVLRGARANLKPEEGQAFVDQQLADRAYLETKVDIGAYFAVHRGMSDLDNATAAMALFDGTQNGIDQAVAAIDGFYQQALDPVTGEFLMQVVGVLDNPFETA